ncbi:glutamate 5-kinase [Anaeromicropila herbilytica]|uniref:Glutamate 5-kinase n=1 Tax=Anaeromicropila herbilytica TaxID=2785025 RepID=A0A7R7ICC4_9FIRM|nr:glutamate 5-kinase [Anaeromicropila herbilytica]BCN30588.1 glutamate 5-kinase [Anaeromicropila herbilytica]
MSNHRELLKDKKRIVIKIGSSSITHANTGGLNLQKMEKLVRVLTDLRNQGKEVVLVSSGAIAVGRTAIGMKEKPTTLSIKQACAAVGQARLMMVYQKLFAEYNQVPAQILMTKYTMINDISRSNAMDTFHELLSMGVIPIVNENDTVSTDEIEFGDNDTLSAIVAALIQADLLILLSDIDGLYTDDPNKNKDAKFIDCVEVIDEKLASMGKGSASSVGTGGMATKISAAKIATDSGADMVIANAKDVRVILDVMEGEPVGTLFKAHKNKNFELLDYIKTEQYS